MTIPDDRHQTDRELAEQRGEQLRNLDSDYARACGEIDYLKAKLRDATEAIRVLSEERDRFRHLGRLTQESIQRMLAITGGVQP